MQPNTNPIPRRARLPLALLAGVTVLAAVRFGVLAWGAIHFPYEIDYGEGIVWQQTRSIVAGHGYARLEPYPAIVFHYPPLFHLLAAMVAATGMDELAAGRLVAVSCTLAGAAMAGLIVAGFARGPAERLPMRLGGAIAGLCLLATQPVLDWAVVMRVDMPFVAFTFAGLWFGIQALRRPWLVHAAALCFVGAIYAKQTAIAAPLAVFAVLLVVRPRTALAGIATGLVAAGALLAAIMVHTRGEFLHHILFYNINRFSWWAGQDLPIIIGMHFGLVLAAAPAYVPRLLAIRQRARATGGLWPLLRAEPIAAAETMVLLHLAIATAMLGMVFKSGSAPNYFLEWMVLVAIGCGLAVADYLVGSPLPEPLWARWRAAVPWIVIVQTLAGATLMEADFEGREERVTDYALLAQAMRAAPAPIISDDMVLLLRAGKSVVMEPSIFAELSAMGVLDDRPMLDRVRRHAFSMIVTDGSPGEPLFDSRYSPAMAHAITNAYPRRFRLAVDYVVRLPAGPLPAWADGLAGHGAD
jgi:hypothetical protein